MEFQPKNNVIKRCAEGIVASGMEFVVNRVVLTNNHPSSFEHYTDGIDFNRVDKYLRAGCTVLSVATGVTFLGAPWYLQRFGIEADAVLPSLVGAFFISNGISLIRRQENRAS